MDPNTGYVKAYVGGINTNILNMTMLKLVSDKWVYFKPLYALALQEDTPLATKYPMCLLFLKKSMGPDKDWVPEPMINTRYVNEFTLWIS